MASFYMEPTEIVELFQVDELRVECEIRGIDLSSSTHKHDLIESLRLEGARLLGSPNVPHQGAVPEVEVDECNKILTHLRRTEAMGDPKSHLDQAKEIMVKCFHWKGRIERIKKYGNKTKVNNCLERIQSTIKSIKNKLEDNIASDVLSKDSELNEVDPASDKNDEMTKEPSSDDGAVGGDNAPQITEKTVNTNEKLAPVKENNPNNIMNLLDAMEKEKEQSTIQLAKPVSKGAIPKSILPRSQENITSSRNHPFFKSWRQPEKELNCRDSSSRWNLPMLQTEEPNNESTRYKRSSVGTNRVLPEIQNAFEDMSFQDDYQDQSKNDRGRFHPMNNMRNSGWNQQAPIQRRVIHDVLKRPKFKNLNFNGSTGSDVHEFIFKFETLAENAGVDTNNLNTYIFDYVSGEALTMIWDFVRENKDAGNVSWEDIKQALITWFVGRDTDSAVRRNLERRIQGKNEPIRNYILEMKKINSQLRRPYPEDELIDIIMENLHHSYQAAMVATKVKTIQDLKKLGEACEYLWRTKPETRTGVNQSSRRPTNNINEILNNSTNPEEEIEEDEDEFIDNWLCTLDKKQLRVLENKIHGKSMLVCWNCKDLGHGFPDCPKDIDRIFCYGCGKDGVKKFDCLTCQKQKMGNSVRGPLAGRGSSNNISRPVPKN